MRHLLSTLYWALSAFRNFLFDKGWLASRRLHHPVISIGNITAGGTGKTPTVISICEMLLAHGFSPVVLSRGYGRSTKGMLRVQPQDSGASKLFGDEPTLIAQHFESRVPVFVGSRRYELGLWAEQELASQQRIVFVLDDGFQHRFVYRDCDVVLISAQSLRHSQELRCLPLGRAREDCAAALKRAHALIVTRSHGYERSQLMAVLRQSAHLPVFWSNAVLHNVLMPLTGGDGVTKESLSGHSVIVACGLGDPKQFVSDLEGQFSVRVSEKIFWSDHYQPTLLDIKRLENLRQQCGCQWILMTAKDTIKLRDLALPSDLAKSILTVEMSLRFDSESAWHNLLLEKVKGHSR